MNEQVRQYENNVIKQCFLNPDVLSHCIARTAGHNIFTQSACRAVWEAFRTCFNNEVNVSVSSVSDVFKSTLFEDESAAEHMIEIFRDIVNAQYDEETEWKYHFHYIHETWKKRKMLDVKKFIEESISTKTSQEISEAVIDKLTDITAGEIEARTFKSSIKATMNDLRDVKSGKKKNIFTTGIPELDKTGVFQVCKEVMIAAVKKCGKTRFVVYLVDKLCSHNDDIAIQWFSLEMRAEENIRMFISNRAKVDDYELTSSEQLDEWKMQSIDMAGHFINEYPIEFIDTPVNIYNIASMHAAFVKKNPGKKPILIIDNIGLIKPHIENPIAFEDDLARHIKNLRDTYQSLIIPVHHMNKETESKLNKDHGYKPRPNHMRGSSRLVDFTNSLIILHRPDMYPDLVEEATAQGNADTINGLFIVDVAINRGGPTKEIAMRHDIGYCQFSEQ